MNMIMMSNSEILQNTVQNVKKKMKKATKVSSHPFVSCQSIQHKFFIAHITNLSDTAEHILIEGSAVETTQSSTSK